MASSPMPPEPSGDFPAWLEAQGVNAEVARAMDSELGIRDYGVLRACVGDGLVRAELLAAARDRLPFGFYAVLRQVVKALRGAGTPRWDDVDAAAYFGDATLAALVEVLLALLSGLNRELLQCMQRLGDMDVLKFAAGSPASASVAGSGDGDDAAAEEMADEMERRGKGGEAREAPLPPPPSPPRVDKFSSSPLGVHTIKTEACPEEDSGLTLGTPSGSGRTQWEGLGPEDSASIPGKSPSGDFPPGFVVAGAGSLQPGGAEPVSATAEPAPFPSWLRQETADETASRESSRLADDDAAGCGGGGGGGGRAAPCPREREFRPGPAPSLSIGESGLYEPRPRGQRAGAGCGGEADSSRQAAGGVGRDNDKPYRCKVCGCGFAQYSTLKRHLHKHNGERPYCCSACGRGFPEPSELRAHEDTHRRDKPHRCRVCGQAFARSCHLTRHQRTHTGEKPYRCGACGHAFTQSCDLKTHERTHTGEKPYRCGACGRGFAQGAHLKRHQRTHSSRKPYRCRPCGQIFLDFGSFNAHQLTHMQNVAAGRAAAMATAAVAAADGLAGTHGVFTTDGNGVP
ncbi:uncharacterized protein LOC116941531 isoform X3 [Petromyzon marinus]